MKICVFDTWNGKFTTSIIKHWEELGHEVFFNPQWEAMEQADITFFYQADNCAIEGVQKPHKGKVFVQAVDIEVWAGQATTVDWSKVDGAIFMAQHIKKYVSERVPLPEKTTIIKPGIDLKAFNLSQEVSKNPLLHKVAYVVGDKRIWDVKRLDICLMMLRDLLDTTKQIWQLHILGSYSTHIQYNDYCDHLLENLELEGFVFWYDRQESVSEWLEDKDFLMLPSTKEAFSYATAEAMAKGIKPIIGNWRGAEDTWGPFYCQTYRQMYLKLTDGIYESEKYRKFVEDNYDQERYFKDLDLFMEIK